MKIVLLMLAFCLALDYSMLACLDSLCAYV